jgi:hypothetical protein
VASSPGSAHACSRWWPITQSLPLLAATWLAEAIGTYQLRLGYRSAAILFLVIGLALLVVVVLASRPLRHRLVATAGITILTGLVGIVVYWQLLAALAGNNLGF